MVFASNREFVELKEARSFGVYLRSSFLQLGFVDSYFRLLGANSN